MSVFKFGEILLPKKIDVSTWSVVACDQYTSQPEYWLKLREKTSGVTSLDLIIPECFLSSDNSEAIARVNAKMREYDRDGVFESVAGTILVERTTQSGTRRGLMLCVNLDEYSFDARERKPIRATEGVVKERLPVRVEIRKDALFELPHVLLLIDDPDRTVIEPLLGKGKEIYSGTLNMGGGEIRGFGITDVSGAERALDNLLEKSIEKYGSPLLFLVGDGNHSLAAAKECVDENNEKSRYALVEVQNIYDEAIKFEPIHRAVWNVDTEDFAGVLKKSLSGNGRIRVEYNGRSEEISCPSDAIETVAAVQKVIDDYLIERGGKVDYIHDDDAVHKIAAKNAGVAIYLNPIAKEKFFDYVANHGNMPRKTFSMGHANEKRYYLEARKIK